MKFPTFQNIELQALVNASRSATRSLRLIPLCYFSRRLVPPLSPPQPCRLRWGVVKRILM